MYQNPTSLRYWVHLPICKHRIELIECSVELHHTLSVALWTYKNRREKSCLLLSPPTMISARRWRWWRCLFKAVHDLMRYCFSSVCAGVYVVIQVSIHNRLVSLYCWWFSILWVLSTLLVVSGCIELSTGGMYAYRFRFREQNDW